ITTGGGGMIVTDDADTAARARHLTTQAKTPGVGYVHDEVGYNYRLTNVAAALGVAQLEQLPAFIAAKRRIAARYRQALEGVVASGVPAAPWAAPSHWLASVLLRDDAPPLTAVLQRLAAEGVQARPLWPPLHQQAPYRDAARLG